MEQVPKRAAEPAYEVFARRGGGQGPSALGGPLADCRVQTWRPSHGVWPPEQGAHFGVWWACHRLGVFRSGLYGVMLVLDGDRVVHRSCLMPSWFRWPFMAPGDVHISDTMTDPDYRGRGIAVEVARRVISATDPSRTVWYAAPESNDASIAVARRAGMEPVGRAVRTRRLRIRLLGSLELVEQR